MFARKLILTAAVAALLAPVAGAHVLANDSAVVSSKYSTSLSTLKTMQKAGTKFHATANSSSAGTRPDDRSGIRGA